MGIDGTYPVYFLPLREFAIENLVNVPSVPRFLPGSFPGFPRRAVYLVSTCMRALIGGISVTNPLDIVMETTRMQSPVVVTSVWLPTIFMNGLLSRRHSSCLFLVALLQFLLGLLSCGGGSTGGTTPPPPPTPDFSLLAEVPSVTVQQQGAYVLQGIGARVANGFAGTIQLTISGAPGRSNDVAWNSRARLPYRSSTGFFLSIGGFLNCRRW